MEARTPIEKLERAVEYVESAENRMHPYVQAGNTTAADARAVLEDMKRLNRQLDVRVAIDSVLCPHAPQHVLEAKCKELEAEVERLREFVKQARHAAWNHRIKHQPYSRLMSIEMDAEELIPQGLDGDPVLKEFIESNRAALEQPND